MPGRVVATCTSRDTLAPARRPFEGYACCEKKKQRRLLRFARIEISFVHAAKIQRRPAPSRVSRETKFNVSSIRSSFDSLSIDRSDQNKVSSLFCFDLETKRFEGWTWISPRNRNKAVANIVERMYLLLRLFTMHRCADPIASYRAR